MTKERFEKSAMASGCHLCVITAHAFDKTAVATFREMAPETKIQPCFTYRGLERGPSGKLTWEHRTQAPPTLLVTIDDGPTGFWLWIRSQGEFAIRNLDIRLPIKPVSQAFEQNDVMITIPRVHTSTGNLQNMELARAWLRTCDEAHPNCKAFAPKRQNWRPSRLIDVGVVGGSGPKLVVSKDNLGAVSYCAFCIFQDSKADGELESPQMSNTYDLATVTIAAGGSRTAMEGIFKRRDPRKLRPCVIKTGNERTSRFHEHGFLWAVYPHRPEQLITRAFGDHPLSLRGWTLQERILSPRLLMFGTDQILWSCVATEARETFPSVLDPRFSIQLSELQSLANQR